jgi:hypothetical protein
VPNVFVLGPALELYDVPQQAMAAPPGRRMVKFASTPILPGEIVNLDFLPPEGYNDQLPVNIYAFFVSPPDRVPPQAERTTDWFFRSGAPSGSISPTNGVACTIAVPNVSPGLNFVQVILEFAA